MPKKGMSVTIEKIREAQKEEKMKVEKDFKAQKLDEKVKMQINKNDDFMIIALMQFSA